MLLIMLQVLTARSNSENGRENLPKSASQQLSSALEKQRLTPSPFKITPISNSFVGSCFDGPCVGLKFSSDSQQHQKSSDLR